MAHTTKSDIIFDIDTHRQENINVAAIPEPGEKIVYRIHSKNVHIIISK